jgi:hypothetical protein
LVRRTRAAKANGEFIEGDEKPFLTAALKDILDGGFGYQRISEVRTDELQVLTRGHYIGRRYLHDLF